MVKSANQYLSVFLINLCLGKRNLSNALYSHPLIWVFVRLTGLYPLFVLSYANWFQAIAGNTYSHYI